jgi:hypothetical protein
MAHKTVKRMYPEDVWGHETLDPVEMLDWAENQWQHFIQAPNRKPLLFRYPPWAERAILRILEIFSRFAKKCSLSVMYLMPLGIPFLPEAPGKTNCLYLVHRANRFPNLREWMANLSGKLIVLTVAEDEFANFSVPDVAAIREEQIPSEDEYTARQSALEYLNNRSNGEAELDEGFRRCRQILTEAGKAGVQLPLGLLTTALRVPFETVLQYLMRPEIADLIRLSGSGPLRTRKVAFRSGWLATLLTEESQKGGHPSLLKLTKFLDPRRTSHRIFLLNLLTALQAQGLVEAKQMLIQKEHSLIAKCRNQSASGREDQAWLYLFHEGLVDQIRLQFYVISRKLRSVFFAPR